eukprot:CAMPEP_0184864954 /NCGR_PEP_ID=MMETSP0580-20130426/16490_1 /TAXON_ID=1118495 /ORGANISM="Dactyliosolen fragilissimus" /LENGTH=434 /DNA_ID=CAMNT_0027363931 /DNA_START=35 /DNA_END=1339 /DNA_ORIENTATION=+
MVWNLTIAYLISSFLRIDGNDSVPSYGVDVSFPMHSFDGVSTNYAWLPHNVDPENNPTPPEYVGVPVQHFSERQSFYEEYVQGCRDYWEEEGHYCDEFEQDRIHQLIDQPASVVNFTEFGYKKIQAPKQIFDLIKDFWDRNKDKDDAENWEVGTTVANYWESPSKHINVADDKNELGGQHLKGSIWNMSEAVIKEWTGLDLLPTSVYGIRVYQEGAVLATHVDRFPLISSAIINVDQDVDEEWPIEMIGRDGIARNVTMKPGEMILYESHSIPHGRPFPLKGRFYANIFVHFQPNPKNEHENILPPYILKDSVYAAHWQEEKKEYQNLQNDEFNQHLSHDAARNGDIETLLQIAQEDYEALHYQDANGWMPIHEGARGGHIGVLQMLVDHGADMNVPTNFGNGKSPLTLALENEQFEVAEFLRYLGAYESEHEL